LPKDLIQLTPYQGDEFVGEEEFNKQMMLFLLWYNA